MNRDDIYDHLAQVYLGKRTKAQAKKKKEFNAWLVINVFITVIILTSAFYGFTAFLKRQSPFLESKIIFSLHNGSVQLQYNFHDSVSPVKEFSLTTPHMDPTKYKKLHFSIRAKAEGSPGMVKVIFKNQKNETASYYVTGIGMSWKDYDIPLQELRHITDWKNLEEISFVLESWNVEQQRGSILIDDISFSS